MLRKLFKRRDPQTPTAAPSRPAPTAQASAATPTATKSPDDLLLELPAAEAAAQIQRIEDVDRLVNLALKARGTLREVVLAQPLLQAGAALTALEKRSRDKDKSLNRHARKQLDRYKALQRETGASRARAEELAAALSRSQPAADDQAGHDRQQQLHQRLNAAIDAYEESSRAIAAFGETLPDLASLRPDPAALLAAPQPAPPAEATATAAAAAATAEEPAGGPAAEPEAAPGELIDASQPDPFEPLVAALQALDQALTAGEPIDAIAETHQTLTEEWLATAARRPPQPAQHAVFELVSQRFRQLADAVARLAAAERPALPVDALTVPEASPGAEWWSGVEERRRLAARLDKLVRSVRWPDWAPPAPEYLGLIGSIEPLRQDLARADALLAAELARLETAVAKLVDAIDAGSLTAARQLLSQARAEQDALPPSAGRELRKRLSQQAARLAELRDWQTYATIPKREALVDAMRALVEAPLPPPDQADRIKQLRADWQGLGPVTQAADGRLADRFNAAASAAFDTCRGWLAEQAELRKTNLAERRLICDQLEHYLQNVDWQTVDIRAAEQIMRTARDAWRTYQPVDRSRGKSVEQRFEALQSQLHDRIKAEWDRNLRTKEAIVAEAQGLLDADLPVESKVATAKNLQQRWRAVGPTPRHPDQRLWQAFREACDSVFSVREQARQEADTAVASVESRCRELLDQFEDTLQNLTATTATEAQLRDFRGAAADIDELPQNRRRDLAARRTELINRYRGLLDAKAEDAHRDRFREFKRWDEAMTDAEATGSAAGSDELTNAAPVPAAVRQARLACAGQPVPLDALRRLTVRAELAAGRESPAADGPLRLQVQVERLQAGLAGNGAAEEPLAMAQQWCSTGPKDAAVAPLRERFFAALTANFGRDAGAGG
jgi:DNA repair protein SbcC/Rad50